MTPTPEQSATNPSTAEQHPGIGHSRPPDIVGIEAVRACWPHEGAAADLVRKLKYRRITSEVTLIADALYAIAPDTAEPSMVTWVPCTPKRRRSRGFDPAEMLARALARRLRMKAVPSLSRLDNLPQTSRSRMGRLSGPRLAALRNRRAITGQVLLVDDVYTTGSTLRSAAAALHSAGAETIVALVATAAVRQRIRPAAPIQDAPGAW